MALPSSSASSMVWLVPCAQHGCLKDRMQLPRQDFQRTCVVLHLTQAHAACKVCRPRCVPKKRGSRFWNWCTDLAEGSGGQVRSVAEQADATAAVAVALLDLAVEQAVLADHVGGRSRQHLPHIARPAAARLRQRAQHPAPGNLNIDQFSRHQSCMEDAQVGCTVRTVPCHAEGSQTGRAKQGNGMHAHGTASAYSRISSQQRDGKAAHS